MVAVIGDEFHGKVLTATHRTSRIGERTMLRSRFYNRKCDALELGDQFHRTIQRSDREGCHPILI